MLSSTGTLPPRVTTTCLAFSSRAVEPVHPPIEKRERDITEHGVWPCVLASGVGLKGWWQTCQELAIRQGFAQPPIKIYFLARASPGPAKAASGTNRDVRAPGRNLFVASLQSFHAMIATIQ